MNINKKSTLISVIIIVISGFIYFFDNDVANKKDILLLEPSLDSSVVKEIRTPRETNLSSVRGVIETTDNNNKYFVEPPKVKHIIRDNIEFIDNIDDLLSATNGKIDDLPLDVRISLGYTLQMCGSLPRTAAYPSEQQENEMYFAGISIEELKKTSDMCREVDTKLIYRSYDLLERAAAEDPEIAAVYFYTAVPPEALAASMEDDYDNLDVEVLQKEHLGKSMPLLQASVLKGSLNATLLLASDLHSSSSEVKENSVQSLSYFLAYNSVIRSKSIQNTITQIGDGLYPDDVSRAIEKANNLIENWNQQPYTTQRGK